MACWNRVLQSDYTTQNFSGYGVEVSYRLLPSHDHLSRALVLINYKQFPFSQVVTNQFRRSMRRSGKFALEAMQQLPGVSAVKAFSTPPGAFIRGWTKSKSDPYCVSAWGRTTPHYIMYSLRPIPLLCLHFIFVWCINLFLTSPIRTPKYLLSLYFHHLQTLFSSDFRQHMIYLFNIRFGCLSLVLAIR